MEKPGQCARFLERVSPHIPSLVRSLTIVEGKGRVLVSNTSQRTTTIADRRKMWAYDDEALLVLLEKMTSVTSLSLANLVWPAFVNADRWQRAIETIATHVGDLEIEHCVFRDMECAQNIFGAARRMLSHVSLKALIFLDCVDIEGDFLEYTTNPGEIGSDDEMDDGMSDDSEEEEEEDMDSDEDQSSDEEDEQIREEGMTEDEWYESHNPTKEADLEEEDARPRIVDLMLELSTESDEKILGYLLRTDSPVVMSTLRSMWLRLNGVSMRLSHCRKFQTLLNCAQDPLTWLFFGDLGPSKRRFHWPSRGYTYMSESRASRYTGVARRRSPELPVHDTGAW